MNLQDALAMIKNGHFQDHEFSPNCNLNSGNHEPLVLDDQDLQAVLAALKESDSIRKVSLWTDLTDAGMGMLTKFLTKDTHIKSFNLINEKGSKELDNKNDLFTEFPEVNFSNVLSSNAALEHLTLSGVIGKFERTKPFFSALKQNTTLKSLALPDNEFGGPNIASEIAEVITNNKKLKILDLSGHLFDSTGIDIIASSLQSNTTLKKLVLSGFWIDDKCAEIFAKQLAKNIQLQSLEFYDNCVTSKGGIALATSLLTNTHLKELKLTGYLVKADCLKLLAEVLATNCSLRNLTLKATSNRGACLTTFADMLDKDTSLVAFDYKTAFNKDDVSNELKIEKILSRNREIKQNEEARRSHNLWNEQHRRPSNLDACTNSHKRAVP